MKTLIQTIPLLAALGLAISQTHADERLFTYSYQAEVLPKGRAEFEQWITHSRGKEEGVFSRWEFREELEYGLTEKLTTALYLNGRSTHSDGVPGRDDEDKFQFKGISSEWKYQLLNPYTQPVGLLAYGEVRYDGEEVELEEKLIFQKSFGEKWVLALNAAVEEEWAFESDETERELALEFSGGLSYRITPRWAIGLEALNRRFFGDYEGQLTDAYFVGPALHYGANRWWATLTVLPQVHGSPDTRSGLQLDEYARIEVRLIAGVNF